MRLPYSLLVAVLVLASGTASAQITVASSGDWSDPTTWSSGAVPTASDDVVIADSTVTIDIPDAVANDVTVSGEGWLRTGRSNPESPFGLTVFGDLTIDGPDAELRPLSNVDDNEVGLGLIYHRLTVHGSIDNSTGGTFDMRRGSTSTTPQDASFIDLVFAGDQDATLELGPYDSNTNQLFRTEIAKEGGATVTMLSDATVDNNSLATFTLTSGYLDTGDYKFELISNNSSVVVGGSPASYVIGELSRGLPKGTVSSQNVRDFPIGDANGYRPATLYVTERPSGNQTFGIRVLPGDADTGSSTFEAPLMDVSPERSYAFTIYALETIDAVMVDAIQISYGTDDQVAEGSTDFVVATSVDDRMTWTSAGGNNPDDTAHTTTLATPPTPIKSAMLTGWTFDFELVGGTTFVGDTYHAAVGTTGMFGTAAQTRPTAGALNLSASPNPSAGIAEVTFTLDTPGQVTAEVIDLLGRRVATLADGPMGAGEQSISWNGGSLAAGLYVVRVQTETVVATRTITLTR
ncbi:MAG: hypothetical protein CMM85_04345 [Rhodothermaceae bacterium]|nr:hypothetical protein [Rhodothermaceae bacterium]